MRFQIYDREYRVRNGIDYAISLQASVLYNGIGKITLIVPATDYYIGIIKENSIIYDTKEELTYIIKNVRYDLAKNQITANGFTYNWKLNTRVISEKVEVSNIEESVYQAVDLNLRDLIEVDVAEPEGLEGTSEAVLFGGQLLDGIMEVLNEGEMGHKMIWDEERRRHTFKIYKGRDLTQGLQAVVFSETFGTAQNLIYETDSSTFRNLFCIPIKYTDGAGVEESRIFEWTDDGDLDDDYYEFWINAEQTCGPDESYSDFLKRVKWKCQEESARRLKRKSFSVVVDPAELGTAYSLGDKVACATERLDIFFEARVTGITYKLDLRGESTSITLGEPRLTALSEVVL